MFPEIVTPRLLLKKISENHKQDIFLGLSHPLVTQYYSVEFSSLQEVQIQMNWYDVLFAKKTGIWWGICLQQNSHLIGACGFNNLSKKHKKAELGFWLHPDHWGKYIMVEALASAIDHAFLKLKLHRIEAFVETENRASKNLLEKLNFTHEGTMADCEIKNGKFISLNIYSLLNTD